MLPSTTSRSRAAVLLFLGGGSLLTTLPSPSAGFVSPAPLSSRHPLGTSLGASERSVDAGRRSLFDAIFEDESDRLFAAFDADDNGTIDREEFRDVVRKINTESRRREVLSVASATFGGILVATASNTFQFGQKALRSRYLEPRAEDAMFANFPTALLSGDADRAIWRTLKRRGFTPSNTLLGHSVCSDEINNRREQLVPLLVERWGEGFALGGLAGLPFAGKSGFGAYLHHVPDEGRLLVVFAPHVGVDGEGRIGALQRDGQAAVSSACGAAIGAYKALQSRRAAPEDPLLVLDNLRPEQEDTRFDPQLDQIVRLLATRLGGLEDSSDSIAFVTYQMYGIIEELITACITQTPDLFESAREVAVVGGIIINRRRGGDFFQPLSFETRRRCASGEAAVLDDPIDLFEETFGPHPDLVPVVGSEAARLRASIPPGTNPQQRMLGRSEAEIPRVTVF